MKNKLINYLGLISHSTWVLVLIIGIGVFVRVYHFSDWLQFSPDQARDALIVEGALEGKASLPLIGPQAGNTSFSVGPLYYEAQYLSAKIFGAHPGALAYPDLFFAILAIPFLFLFLRKYFDIKISLGLVAILSISYFAIINSRFASNPNSIPFFVLLFLFAILEIMEAKDSKKILFWYAVLGIATGVGFQLHTLLVFTLPATILLVLMWLIRKKMFSGKGFVIMIVFFLLLNIGQLISELKTNGQNSAALISGIGSHAKSNGAFLKNVKIIASCQLEANIHFISSLENNKECGRLFDVRGVKNGQISVTSLISRNRTNFLAVIFGFVFSLGGMWFLIKNWRKETDLKKKNFLGLVAIYSLISFIVLVPVAGEVELRYFNVVFILPFIFLGLWLDVFAKNKKVGKLLVVVVVGLLGVSNLYVDSVFAVKYLNQEMSDDANSILGEIRPMARYISDNKNSEKKVLLSGGRRYTKRFYKPFFYLLQKEGIELIKDDAGKVVLPGEKIFQINNNLGKKYIIGGKIQNLEIENIEHFNENVSIYVLKK